MSGLELIVRGARGSMSVSGLQYAKYGGNTTCFQLEVEDRQILFDCGTGLRSVQHSLATDPSEFVVFLTHYHWDHLQGIPVFAPLYLPGNTFTFYGPAPSQGSVEDVIDAVIRPPWFPVSFRDAAADVSCLPVPAEVSIGDVRIRSFPLSHPDPVVGYRIDGPNRSIVLATDHESGTHAVDAGLIDLARGADVLIHDGQYTPSDYVDFRIGWGHSTWEHATKAAVESGVDELFLTSHDPDHSDADLDTIEEEARAVFANTTAIREGTAIPL